MGFKSPPITLFIIYRVGYTLFITLVTSFQPPPSNDIVELRVCAMKWRSRKYKVCTPSISISIWAKPFLNRTPLNMISILKITLGFYA